MTTRYWPAEIVLPGHPDKLCDAIADRIVEEAAHREQRALCGVEVAVHRDQVFVTGRVAGQDAETIDIPAIARDVFAGSGYNSGWRPAPSELRVTTDLCVGPLNPGEAEFRAFADDQSIVTGYAVDLAGTNFLPPEHWLVHQFGHRLHQLRATRLDLDLGPDGKALVVLAEASDRLAVATVSVSLQQGSGGSAVELTRAVRELVADTLASAAAAIPGFDPAVPDEVLVNAAGDFVVGGPEGDNGLSGKKLVIDGYGPRAPIGGGALSGKDFYKADRAGALLARRLARAIVQTGAASACSATLIFTPGADRARILSLETSENRNLAPGRWERLLDLSLAGIGDRYARTPCLAEIARWGHFTNPHLPWERMSFDGDEG